MHLKSLGLGVLLHENFLPLNLLCSWALVQMPRMIENPRMSTLKELGQEAVDSFRRWRVLCPHVPWVSLSMKNCWSQGDHLFPHLYLALWLCFETLWLPPFP